MTAQTIAEKAVIMLRTHLSEAETATLSHTTRMDSGPEKHFYDTIFRRIQQANDHGRSIKVFDNFRDDPEEYQINLANKLVEILQNDHAFAQELGNMLQRGPVQEILANDRSTAYRNQIRNKLGRGIQRIKLDHDSHAHDNIIEID